MKNKTFHEIDHELNRVAEQVVDSAFKVHCTMGPGLLESVYEIFLTHELKLRGFKVEKQVVLPLTYEGLTVDAGLRLDLLVENNLIVELKAVEMILPVHQAQLTTYLKLSGRKLGLLINFNVSLIKEGIRRVVLSNSN